MMDITKFENLSELIIEIRGRRILLDRDVADLYGVETKRINDAVKNNLDKFPDGYIMESEQRLFVGNDCRLMLPISRFKTRPH